MKTAKLLSTLKESPYFTKQNLSVALAKEGEGLNYWIKKLLKEKTLISLKKGLYISSYYKDLVTQNPNELEAYFEYLANILRFPSYLSLEYILAKRNLIPEAAFALTSVTTKSSRVYTSEMGTFIYKNIKENLFFGYRPRNFQDKNVKIASSAKALFDFLYFKKFTSKMKLESYLLRDARINWEVLNKEDKKEFIETIAVSESKKMDQVVSILKKEKIL